MAKIEKFKQFNDLLLEGHKLSVQRAIETSIRTGTSLIIEENGQIIELKPKYKYVLVPIKAAKKKRSPLKSKKSNLKKSA